MTKEKEKKKWRWIIGKDRWGKGTKKKGKERENEQVNENLRGKKVQNMYISLWECKGNLIKLQDH